MSKCGALLWLREELRRRADAAEEAGDEDEACRLDRRAAHVEKLLAAGAAETRKG